MQTPAPKIENKANTTTKATGPFFGGSSTPFFQPKLTVNQPGDVHEQEADQVADQVMRMDADIKQPAIGGNKERAPQSMVNTNISFVQRACTACEQKDEETLQRKETANDAGGDAAPPIVADVLSSGAGQALDADTKGFMESRMGQDFSQVRVHTDARAAESATAIQAKAYTSGNNIVFKAGAYQPQLEEGRHLLAHELTHVVQQGASREAPGVQRSNSPSGKGKSADAGNGNKQNPQPGGSGADAIKISPASPTAILRVEDETVLTRGINRRQAFPKNLEHWERLQLSLAPPFLEFNPTEHPNAYANHTLQVQRLINTTLRQQHRPTLREDGILGPKTAFLLRLIAYNRGNQVISAQLMGLGVNFASIGSEPGATVADNILAELNPPDFVSVWREEVSGLSMLDYYESNHSEMVSHDRAALDQLLFQGPSPQFITDGDVIQLMRNIYGQRSFKSMMSFVRISGRSFIHNFDYERLDHRRSFNIRILSNRPNYIFFKFSATDQADLGAIRSSLNIHFPRTRAARAVLTEIDSRLDSVVLPGESLPQGFPAFLCNVYLPELEQSVINAAAGPFLDERRRQEEAREREQQEAVDRVVTSAADNIVRLINEDEQFAEFRIEEQLHRFERAPRAFEQLIDRLKSHPSGDYFQRMERFLADDEQQRILQFIVRMALETRHANDPVVLHAITRLNEIRRSRLDHVFVAGDQPYVLLDGRTRLEVGEVAGDKDSMYLTDEPVQRLKEAKRLQLQRRTEEIARQRYADMLAGRDTSSFTQEGFVNAILQQAVRETGITNDDIEEVTRDESVRLLGVTRRIENGEERFDVQYQRVYREDGGAWMNRSEHAENATEMRFDELLFWYRFSQISDVTIAMAKIVSFGAVAIIAWEVGLVGALVGWAGGGTVVLTSMALSALIYVISNWHHLTVEGFLVSLLVGYLGALGFALFNPVGQAAGRFILGEVVAGTLTRRAVAAWLVARGTTGVLAGGSTSVAMLFVEDLIRVAAHDGNFSSFSTYLRQAGWGMMLGAAFEIGGAVVLGPLLRSASNTTLQSLREVILLANSHNVPIPTCWAESVLAMSRITAWAGRNVVSQEGRTILLQVFRERLSLFMSEYALGLRTALSRQVFEFAEIQLTSRAVDGLQRLLRTAPTQADDAALAPVLNQLLRNPDRTRSILFFEFLQGIDDRLMAQLTREAQMSSLAEAAQLLAFSQRLGVAKMEFILVSRFGSNIQQYEGYLQRLMGVAEAQRDEIIGLLNLRGTAVSPESLLRIAVVGEPLNQEMVGGLMKLMGNGLNVAHGQSVDLFLASLPGDRIGGFLRRANQAQGAELADLTTLAGSGQRGANIVGGLRDIDEALFQLGREVGPRTSRTRRSLQEVERAVLAANQDILSRLQIDMLDLVVPPGSGGRVFKPRARLDNPAEEIRFGNRVAALANDDLILSRIDDEAAVDGIYRNTQQPVQVKSLQGANQERNMIRRINEAYQSSLNNLWRNIDLHIEAAGIDQATALQRWGAARAQPTNPFRNDGRISRVVVHCSDGAVILPLN